MTLVKAPETIRCIGQVPGCPLCAGEPLIDGDEHVCGFLCELQMLNRETETGHAQTHQPRRHECGEVLDDRQGGRFEIQKFCGWGTCVQYFCPGCRRFTSGFGPVGCQCEDQPCGHGTAAEYAKPGITNTGKAKKSLFRRLRK